MRNFTPKELQEYLAQAETQPLLLDVREPWEFEYCAIKGSILIPMGELPNEVDTLDPNKETIMICHHGIRSRHMGYYMEQVGFTSITNLEGGVERWAEDVEPDMKRY